MYASHRGRVYDINDAKTSSGIGTAIACFLPKLLPVLKGLGKSLLDGLAIGAAFEGASQAMKTTEGKKVGGIFLKTKIGKGQPMIHDILQKVEEITGMKYGSGVLSSLGIKMSLSKIPLPADTLF